MTNDGLLLVRLDFSDDAGWHRLVSEAADPGNSLGEPFHALRVVDDPRWDGLSWREVLAATEVFDDGIELVAVAESRSLSDDLMPLLILPLMPKAEAREDGFWCAAASLASVQAQFLVSNMDWESFHDALDDSEDVYFG